jgi:hypothetical protein
MLGKFSGWKIMGFDYDEDFSIKKGAAISSF